MKKKVFKCGIYCALLFLIIIFPALVIGKGKLFMSADFNSQQIPFNILCNKSIKEGNFFWNWNTDLGSNFIASYSFYNIGSPFFWIMMLVPSKFVVYAMAPILVLKFMVSGCSSFLYLRQYVKNENFACIGAVLYTFSGFVFSNLFYNHFMDVIALFPFILLALDQNVKNEKKYVFSIMVAIMAMTNYVFFVMEVIFIILYFCCKVYTHEYNITLKKIINLAFESILGFGVSCVIVIPSVIDLLGNPRSTARFTNIYDMLVYGVDQYILILKAAFLPADLQNGAALYENRWTCTELYLPMIGMIFVISYMIHCKKKENFIFNMLLICTVFSFVPLLNSSFQLLNKAYYTRWFFMFTLMLALASIKAIEEQYEIVSGAIVSAGIVVGLILYFNRKGVINNKFYMWIVTTAILGIMFTLISKYNSKKKVYQNMFISILIFSVLGGSAHFYNMFNYKDIDNYFDNFIGFQENNDLKNEEFYRTENKEWNTSMVSDNKDIICWNSTVSASIFSFYNNVGAGRHITSIADDSLYGLRSLLSVKYLYNNDNEYLDTKVYSDNGINRIYENLDYIPMGFAFDYYITEEEYQAIPVEKRHLILLKALVVSDQELNENTGGLSCLKKLDINEMGDLNYNSFEKDVQDRRQITCDIFEQKKNGFTAKINLKSEKMIFFSVPYDKGWSAFINGEKVEIIKVDDGLMALKCQKGINNIEFNYIPQGFKFGAILSIVSFVLICVGICINKRVKLHDEASTSK